MLANEFRQRFLLQQPDISDFSTPAASNQAAVLVPIVDYGHQLNVLFTKRALHMRHHPGQISFPGGRIEKNEHSKDAALRETYEEIGISPHAIELLGTLNTQGTNSGFCIIPWVGFIKPHQRFSLQQEEVDSVFEVPLTHFLNANNRHAFNLYLKQQNHTLYAIPYQDKFIWGATAAILHQLCLQIA